MAGVRRSGARERPAPGFEARPGAPLPPRFLSWTRGCHPARGTHGGPVRTQERTCVKRRDLSVKL